VTADADRVGGPERRASGRHAAQHRRPGPKRRLAQRAGIIVAGCGVAVTALGLAGWASGLGRQPGQSGAERAGRASLARDVRVPRGRAEPTARSGREIDVARPVRLVIPAIGVTTRLIRLGVSEAGTLEVPASAAVAGWFTGSPRPGAVGASIIAGHIDSRLGPGVFFRLARLRRGQRVYVVRADRSVARFKIISVRSYAKSRFPRAVVYGPVPDAELRLITCGGNFDFATGSYLDNVVVYAVLIR
jgi:sortase (surface protein transpeptidase)